MKHSVRSLRAPMVALAVLMGACAEDGELPADDENEPAEPEPIPLPIVEGAISERVTLVASRDTSVRSNTPNRPEGALTVLSGSRSLVAFDQAALVAALGKQDVLLSATLRLTPPSSGQPTTTAVGVYRTTQAWTEVGATYNCANDTRPSNQNLDCTRDNRWSMDASPPNPWFSTPTATGTFFQGNRKPVEFNVTADVKGFLNGKVKNEGWLVRGGLRFRADGVTVDDSAEAAVEASAEASGDSARGFGNPVFQSRENTAPPTLVLAVRRCSAEVCDDGDTCTVDSCDAQGFCVYNPAPAGTSCDDGDACTVGEVCSDAVCTPGDVVSCGDSARVVINEVESNGGTPDDWVELYNAGTRSVDVSGWTIKDNDDTHSYALPVGSVLAPGAYLVAEAASLTFGLGGADSVRLFDARATLVDSYTWTSHAAITYGRCPNGSGALTNTSAATKGATNACDTTPVCTPGAPGCAVVINEVESNNGLPDDWIELYNQATTPIDVSGWVVKDNDDTHAYTLPANTVLAPASYLVIESATLTFGLGAADSARLFTAAAVLADSYTWSAHASVTYGRCPNGTGAFSTTTNSTKGAANDCTPSGVMFTPWPGGTSVSVVDAASTFAGNLSGLSYQTAGDGLPAILWGVQNGPSLLHRLVFDGTNWLPSNADDWQLGKTLLYPSGSGSPDAEGLTRAAPSSPHLYVASERNNDDNAVSRLSVLRYDTSASGATLTAVQEWNLTADLPASAPNVGLEAIAWVPDADLVAQGFRDDSQAAPYDPASYPEHGGGVFFVGLESSGTLYGYVLDHTSTGFTRVSTATSGQPLSTDLSYDRELGQLWSYCDDACGNRGTILRVQADTASPDAGTFTVRAGYERPSEMANFANEGIAFGSETECTAGTKPFFWADDADTGGFSIRQGTLTCGPLP